jgi:phosphoribosyl-ATP pyrophosphohydrolase
VGFTLETLSETLARRASSTAERSYTKSLLEAGAARCAKKFGEEAFELALAAVSGDRGAVVAESADVLYHLLVILLATGVPLSDVLAELERRTAQSGLQEKASRGAGAPGESSR